MKNPIKIKKSILRNIILPMLIIITFFCQSCDTEIPPTDTDPPTFAFRITGDGFERTFTQDDDFESFQLNLKDDQEYDFIYSPGDTGGLKTAQIHYITDYFELETDVPAAWTLLSRGLSSTLLWQGDVNNPFTGTILNGTFRVNRDNDLVSFNIDFDVRDFGGESGSSNQTFKSLNILVGQHATEIVYFPN